MMGFDTPMSGIDPNMKHLWRHLPWVRRNRSRDASIKATADESTSLWVQSLHRLCKDPLAMIGLATLILLIMIAVFAPFLAPYRSRLPSTSATRLQWTVRRTTSSGTDKFGRDVLSRTDLRGEAVIAHARH